MCSAWMCSGPPSGTASAWIACWKKSARGHNGDFDRYLAALTRQLPAMSGDERAARALSEQLALALQASLMLRHGLPASADYFCRRYLAGDRLGLFGGFAGDCSFNDIIDYAFSP